MSDQIKCHKHESRLSIRDTFNGMSMNEMIRLHGVPRSQVAIVLDLVLVRFLKSVNITTQMDSYQKKEIVLTMLENYPHETINDFLLCFKMARLGTFGPIYNRLDITVISEYMTKYLESKAFEREAIEKQVEGQSKAVEYETINFDTQEEYDEFVAKNAADKKKWYDEQMVLHSKLTEVQKRANRLKQFGVMSSNENEAGYTAFKKKYLNRKDDDGNGGAGMGIDDHTGTNHDVSISDERGSGVDDTIQRPGSQHSEQGDGV